MLLVAFAVLLFASACKNDSEAQRVRPRQLRDVPAQRLAFTFSADVEAPANISADEAKTIQAIQQDFDLRRKDEELVLHRTVASPDGQRALALYSGQDEPSTTFHIDLYSSSGSFIRNLTPPDLAVVFQDSVLWSADSGYIAFVGRKAAQAQPSPTPPGLAPPEPEESPVPSPTVMPAFPPVATFSTEQIYISDKDGYGLRPLTTRDGLIYFSLAWAPDGHAVSALACKVSEWDAREREFQTPTGRPRVVTLDGQERLLDDELAQAPPVWSPDSAKIATAFDVDIGIYDAVGKSPTQARIVLHERMLTASAAFEEKSGSKRPANANASPTPSPTPPASFRPIIRIEWSVPEKLYLQTGAFDLRNGFPTFSRWHLLTLSAQAAVLGRG